MPTDTLFKGDMVMLPRRGDMPTRHVLLIDVEPTETFTSDGNELYWVSWLGDDGQMQENMIVNPAMVTLIARKE